MTKSVRIMVTLGSVMIMSLALNLGVAFADGGHYSGGAETDGINTAQNAEAYAPVGSAINDPSLPGYPGIVNGFDGGDPESPAVVAITNNPLCPLHPGNAH